jgi:hypothetical protein
LKRNSSTIREGTGWFTKNSNSILLEGDEMGFIECELFHDKRRNLMVYEKLQPDFIRTESWWDLLSEVLPR